MVQKWKKRNKTQRTSRKPFHLHDAISH